MDKGEAEAMNGSSADVEEDQIMANHNSDSKICYTRYNSPFWQIVIVSFVAFG
jgi:hypothetical protein